MKPSVDSATSRSLLFVLSFNTTTARLLRQHNSFFNTALLSCAHDSVDSLGELKTFFSDDAFKTNVSPSTELHVLRLARTTLNPSQAMPSNYD